MNFIYLAKSSSCEIKKALIFLIFITGWVALSILPIHLDNSDDGNRWATTILLIPPIPLTSFYILAAFVYVVFNQNPDDDSKINIVALMLILIAWIVSWSSLYLIYWSWDNSTFPKLPAISEPYEAWGYMIAISAGIYVADQPLSADAVGVDLNLLATLQSVASTFINIALFATVTAMVYSFVREKNTSVVKKRDSDFVIPSNKPQYSYQPAQQQFNPYASPSSSGFLMSVEN